MTIIRPGSAWSPARIEQFLQSVTIPIRLGCQDPDGVPLVCSLWYLYADDALWCATQRSSRVVALLQDRPECGFEVAPEKPPYSGVRGQGHAELLPGEGIPVLLQLIDRYLGTRDTRFARWLIGRGDAEVAIRIRPDWLTSWDFSARM